MLYHVALIVLAMVVLKLLVHHLRLEVITVNPLFSALVASTVFLLGFLLNGVLTDFKESEKIPGELASALEALSWEIRGITVHHPGAEVERQLQAVADLSQAVLAWARQSMSTPDLMVQLDRCHGEVVTAARLLSASTLKGRLMTEMASILRAVNRIETIRETSFVPLAYWMAYAGTILLSVGLILMRGGSLWESIFFLCVIAFLLIFLLQLIHDIDNPFGIGDPRSAEDVSLEVLQAAADRLEARQVYPAP